MVNVQTQLILMLYALFAVKSREGSVDIGFKPSLRHRGSLTLLHGNNNGADLPVHKRSMISPFVI